MKVHIVVFAGRPSSIILFESVISVGALFVIGQALVSPRIVHQSNNMRLLRAVSPRQ